MATEEEEISFLLFITKMYESTENYEKMREAITKLTKVKCSKSLHLSLEERNLLSIAYNNCVGERRCSCRVLCYIEEKLLKFSDAKSVSKLKIVSDFKERVRSELIQICTEILDLLDSYLLPISARIVEKELFYTKMKADHCRYLIEVETGDKKEVAAAEGLKGFESVIELVFSTDQDSSLPLAHPIRLRMGLSYASFYYEVYEKPELALKIAERTAKMGLSGLENVVGDMYKESVLILDLLQDNIAVWKRELN